MVRGWSHGAAAAAAMLNTFGFKLSAMLLFSLLGNVMSFERQDFYFVSPKCSLGPEGAYQHNGARSMFLKSS